MHNTPLVLALDIGTSSVRAMLFDAYGNSQPGDAVQIAYRQKTSGDGGVQTGAEDLLKHTVTALERMLQRSSKRNVSRIAAVGFSCFWHSLIGVDGNFEAITPVYSWADSRSSGQAAELRRHFVEHDYHARTGCFLHSSYWPAKLTWLTAENPELFSRVKRWMGFGEYALHKLTGAVQQSRSMASATGIYDSKRNIWDEEVLQAVQLTRDKLLPVSGEYTTITELAMEYGSRLAPLNGVQWTLPVGDGACSNVGSGAYDPSLLAINLGTSGALRAATSSRVCFAMLWTMT